MSSCTRERLTPSSCESARNWSRRWPSRLGGNIDRARGAHVDSRPSPVCAAGPKSVLNGVGKRVWEGAIRAFALAQHQRAGKHQQHGGNLRPVDCALEDRAAALRIAPQFGQVDGDSRSHQATGRPRRPGGARAATRPREEWRARGTPAPRRPARDAVECRVARRSRSRRGYGCR